MLANSDINLLWFLIAFAVLVASIIVVSKLWNKIFHTKSERGVERPSDPFERFTFDRNDPDFQVRNWLVREIEWYREEIERKENEHNRETPEVEEWLFWVITAVVVLSFAVLLYASSFLPSIATVAGFQVNPHWIVYAAIGVYVLAGFRAIDTDKVAGLDFFGTPVRQYGNGLKWYPWGILNLTIETAQLVQGEMPGDADHIFWDEEEKLLPTNLVRPIYVLSGENPKGKLPTDKQTNLGVSFLVKFQLTRSRFFDLVRNVAPVDPENGEMIRNTVTGNEAVTDRLIEVLRHLRDTGTAFAAGILGKLSYNEITTHRHLVDELLKLRVKLEIVPWGLKLEEARFTQINPGHSYNKDLQRRASAITERDTLEIVAEGKKTDLIKVGQGEAAARKAYLLAEAKGQKAIRDELGVSGDTAVAAEVAKELAKGGNTVLAPSITGLGAMLGIGASKTKGKDSDTPSDDK